MPSGSPQLVIERAHAFVRDYDIRFADCFSLDAVLELPFAPPGMSKRLVGRDAIRAVLEPAYLAAREAGRKIIEYADTRLHATGDPEVVVHEFTLRGRRRMALATSCRSSRCSACVVARSSRCGTTSTASRSLGESRHHRRARSHLARCSRS